MTVRVKVGLFFLLLYAAGGYGLSQWIVRNIRPQFLRVMEDAMADHAYLLAELVSAGLPEQPTARDFQSAQLTQLMRRVRGARVEVPIHEWVKTHIDFRVLITDAKGIVRFDSEGRLVGLDYHRWHDVHVALLGQYGARSSIEPDRRDATGQRLKSLFVAFPLRKSGRIVGSLSLVKPQNSLRNWVDRAQRKLWTVYLIGAPLLFLLSLLVMQRLLRPVFRLTRYARAVADGQDGTPPAAGGGEFGQLTRAFADMRERLLQRRVVEETVTQLTHELKSPISAISGAAELLDDPEMPDSDRALFLRNIREQSQRMQDIVERLLRLVALEQRDAPDRSEPIATQELAQQLERDFVAQCTQRAIAWRVALDDSVPAVIRGDRFLVAQALANLVQNAVQFTPNGGQIDVRFSRHADQLLIEVSDTGLGVPEFALPHVMERFYSLEHPATQRKGTGLGLPFVGQVARLHHGSFTLRNNASGVGAVASLRLAA